MSWDNRSYYCWLPNLIINQNCQFQRKSGFRVGQIIFKLQHDNPRNNIISKCGWRTSTMDECSGRRYPVAKCNQSPKAINWLVFGLYSLVSRIDRWQRLVFGVTQVLGRALHTWELVQPLKFKSKSQWHYNYYRGSNT